MMQVLIIDPRNHFVSSRGRPIPAGVAYITTSLELRGYLVDLYDLNKQGSSYQHLEAFLQQKKYDVICIGAVVSSYKPVKFLVQLIKRILPDTVVIIGNTLSHSAHIVMENCPVDYMLDGESDQSIIDLLDAIHGTKDIGSVHGLFYKKNGITTYTGLPSVMPSLENLPFIRRETLIRNGEADRFILIMSTSRGCTNNCTFCSHNFKHVPYRERPMGEVVGEVKSAVKKNPQYRYISLSDELTFASKERFLEFSQGLIKNKIKLKWNASIRSDLFDSDADVNLLRYARKSGLDQLFTGLESGSSETLKKIGKGITRESFTKQVALCRKADINIWPSLIIGFPWETKESIDETFDLLEENKIFAGVGFLIPQPRTFFYNDMLRKGRIKDEERYLLDMWGSRHQLIVNLTQMSDSELLGYTHFRAKRLAEELGMEKTSQDLLLQPSRKKKRL